MFEGSSYTGLLRQVCCLSRARFRQSFNVQGWCTSAVLMLHFGIFLCYNISFFSMSIFFKNKSFKINLDASSDLANGEPPRFFYKSTKFHNVFLQTRSVLHLVPNFF